MAQTTVISAVAKVPRAGIAPTSDICKYNKNGIDPNSPKYNAPNRSWAACMISACPDEIVDDITITKTAAMNTSVRPALPKNSGLRTAASPSVSQMARPHKTNQGGDTAKTRPAG